MVSTASSFGKASSVKSKRYPGLPLLAPSAMVSRSAEAFRLSLQPATSSFLLSRSRVHTPPGKDKQRIVHALCSLNEATVKRQTTYEDLRMIKSVVK
jgi:hypothetical protein